MTSSTKSLSHRNSSDYKNINIPITQTLSTSSSLVSDTNTIIGQNSGIKMSLRLQRLMRFADSIAYSSGSAGPADASEEHSESLMPKVTCIHRNVYVLQRECVLTKTSQIVTPSFASCYVLAGYDSITQYKFMAHIDDCTTLTSIRSIFAELYQLGVKKKNLSLSLAGGWKIKDSAIWGKAIMKILKAEKLWAKTNLSFFQKKSPHSQELVINFNFHSYPGAVIEMNGNFRLIQEREILEDAFQDMIRKITFPETRLSPLKIYEAK